MVEIHYLYRKKTALQKLVYTFLTIIGLLPISNLCAQQWEAGANIGTTGYMGDINPDNPFYFRSMGGGLSGKYNFDPTWGIKAGGNFLHVYGSDQDKSSEFHQNRNLSFQNKIVEFSVVGEFNFFKFVPGKNKLTYTPYLFAGIAGIYHSPYVTFASGDKQALGELQLEYDVDHNPTTYGKIAIAIPFGFGFKYNIKGPWSIGAELGYRTVLSDNIDNVSKNYATTRPTAGPGSAIGIGLWEDLADRSGNWATNKGKLRGDGRPHDGYMTLGLTLTYTFISQKCYWW